MNRLLPAADPALDGMEVFVDIGLCGHRVVLGTPCANGPSKVRPRFWFENASDDSHALAHHEIKKLRQVDPRHIGSA